MFRLLVFGLLVLVAIAACAFVVERIGDPDKEPAVILSVLAITLSMWNLLSPILARPCICLAAVYLDAESGVIGDSIYPLVVVFYNAGDRAASIRVTRCYSSRTISWWQRSWHKPFWFTRATSRRMEPCHFTPKNMWVTVEPHRIATAVVKVECHQEWACFGIEIDRVGSLYRRLVMFMPGDSHNADTPNQR